MAAVDFGDSQLFQQLDDASVRVAKHIHFTDDEEHQEQRSRQRSRLEECEDYIERLTEENKGLRRKQSILMRPSGITIEDVNVDGPVLQILYSNNAISKQCRQEIEDCMCNVILKHQNPSNESKKSTIHMIPQTMQAILGSPGPSMNLGDPQSIAGSSARYSSGSLAFALDEDPQMSLSSSIKTTTEAFKVVGSVLYFTTFSLDKLGQPLVNENPQLTDGWDVPMYLKDQSYHQIFNQVIGTDGQEIEMKDKRPKSMCFNCGSSNHQLRDCPMPKDMAAINERRKEFNQNSSQIMQSNQRYHADEVEERFAKYKPGVMSEELLTALGIDDNALPPLIYRMRQLGYPPGWLKEAEMENSGLTLYDGNVSNDNNITDDTNSQSICYDVSKLIDFPGFNVPTPNTMKDEYMQYGSVPMQYNHMKQNFAAYLSSNFPLPGATCNKRPHESDSSPQAKKRTRPSPCGSSDMDIESDPGTPYHHDFTFQPPLPPGSPCFSSPPPLPQGTPPATPTPPPLPKATPLTPTNGSPALKGRSWVGNETVEAAEDDLTLEELEEQQRLIWAALENADTATNSDCETPVLSSPSVSTPVHADTETEENEEAVETTKPAEIGHCEIQRDIVDKEICSQGSGLVNFEDDIPESPELVKSQDDSHQSPGPVKSQDDSHQSPGPVKSQDDSNQSPGPVKSQDDSHQSPGPVKSQDDSHQSPGPVKSQEDSHQSPGPVKSQEDSHQSPGPVKSQDDSPQSPGPLKSKDDSPQSPGPVKSQDDSPQSPGPVKSQDDSPQSPGPVRSQDDSPQSPGPVKSQDDSPKNPGPVRSQDDSPRGTGPVRSQDDSPLNPDPKICQGDNGHGHDPEFLAAEDCASPKHFEKVTAVPHRSNFAAGIVPFEDTPEFTEVAAATGTYLKIRDLLKSSPRNLVKKK